MPDQEVDSLRREINGECHRDLGEAAFGLPSDLLARTRGNVRSARAEQSARRKDFPILRTSLVSTMVITIVVLRYLQPASPASLVTAPPVPEPVMSVETEQVPVSDVHEAAPEAPRFVEPEHVEQVPVDAAPVVVESHPPLFVRADNKVGIYLTASSIGRKKFFEDSVDDLRAASGSAIVMDVKGSAVYFHSAAPLANDVGLVRPLYDLPEILQRLHGSGVYVIGRFVSIKDAGLTTKKPDTRIKDPVSGRVLSQDWVDPSDETAITYNSEVVCELARAGIDEINLDYIRFSTAEFGALRAYSGEEKADRVEVFIRAIRNEINRCGPQTKLGLSTFAILGWNYPVNMETLGQDFVRFAPLVDIISPMAYPATFAEGAYYVPGKDPRSRMYFLVYRTLTGYAELLGPEHAHKIRPWIQGYGVTTKNMKDQIDAVYDAGACGYTVWNANNAYAPTYAAMKTDTTRPERCK